VEWCVRLRISRRERPARVVEPRVTEIVTPRTNVATLSSAEHLFAALALDEPCSLEIAAGDRSRRFLMRASSPRMHQHLLTQVGSAYPQAEFRPIEAADDPVRRRPGEQVHGSVLRLRAPEYLPLRTFTDTDVDGERAAQADPVLGILGALGDLPHGWRGLSQLVVEPAPRDWSRPYQRLAVQHPLEHERVQRAAESPLPMLGFVAAVLSLATIGLQAYVWAHSGQWPLLLGLIAGVLVGIPLLVGAVRRFARAAVYDMDLVREKVARTGCRAEVRLVLFAPASVSRSSVVAQLERIAAAYQRYSLAAANGFVARPVQVDPEQLALPDCLRSRRGLPILNSLELAGVWHLPHAANDVALLERTTARRWLPLPAAVVRGCRIGLSTHQGREVPVALGPEVLSRHLLLVAKTRRGKSTLMQRLAQFAMQVEPRRAVLLVDPHRDLAEATLCLVPPDRRADVVFLDVAQHAWPFGLNLLDARLGWDRDRAVANALVVFQREWGDRFWGPRMEDAFRFALLSLFEANAALCAADPGGGRAAQYTVLEVPNLLQDVSFRREVLASVRDASVKAWWSDYFEPLDRRFQLELINPVLTKIHRFEGSTAARHIVGQPASTIDPAGWLHAGKVVIVNTARGDVGDNTAALIGGTLINLVTLAVAEQARLEPASRRPISMFVDEFHTIPGADYEAILAELSKYGASLALATQSLARLLGGGRDDGRELRSMVFANIDGLFAFNCSAEDAEYLVPELGGTLDQQDLVELGEHQCYLRLSSRGERLPTFWVSLDPPLTIDARVGAEVARASALRYGREVALVEADRASALARVLQARQRHLPPTVPPSPPAAPGARARNQHRPRKKQRQPEVSAMTP
jgi:hypothetical protein